MRVLVCGDRKPSRWGIPDFQQWIYNHLDQLHKYKMIDSVVEGDAPGVDRIAGYWARKNGLTNLKFPVDWEKYGTAAGPIRNKQMLDEGKPDLVIAFPGGKGTANMVKLAKRAGVEVIEIGKEKDGG